MSLPNKDYFNEDGTVKDFTIKDSGKREEFASGMVRDTTEGKTDYGLVLDGPMFKRWAIHMTKGAVKYAKRNWMQAKGQPEYDRFKESALRHFMQWYNGDTDEDHAAAVFFNINGAEYVAEQKVVYTKPDPCTYDETPFPHFDTPLLDMMEKTRAPGAVVDLRARE